jgi:hypothetical protein
MICRDMTAAWAALGRTAGLAARHAAHKEVMLAPTLADKPANLEMPAPSPPGTQLGTATPLASPAETQPGMDKAPPARTATAEGGGAAPFDSPAAQREAGGPGFCEVGGPGFCEAGPGFGRACVPVRQAANSAPSEYMSVAGVAGPPPICSGAV